MPTNGFSRQPIKQLWTVGHWTQPEEEFLRPLLKHRIDVVADVRSFPGSRRNPQFGKEIMPAWLRAAGVDYIHLPELGGRRRAQPVEPGVNAGWREASFKNYADYTLTAGYESGIDTLTSLADDCRVVIMCSEATPWRCHRQLVANTLTARGWQVWHLIGAAAPRLHVLGQWGATPVARDDGTVVYPADLAA